MFAVFLCAQMSYAGRGLESLYLMNRPLCWEPGHLGLFAGIALAASALATLFSTKCLVRIPNFGGDISLLFISLASGAAAYGILAFARWSWMVWVYVGVGSFKVTAGFSFNIFCFMFSWIFIFY